MEIPSHTDLYQQPPRPPLTPSSDCKQKLANANLTRRNLYRGGDGHMSVCVFKWR